MGIPMTQPNIHDPTTKARGTAAPSTGSDASVHDLMAQRDTLEAELKALGSVLDSHGVTMTTSLTTFDGFPRADIDVAQVRTARARIVRLRNDHAALTARIEPLLHAHFAALAAASPASTTSVPAAAGDGDQPAGTPFARVNSVETGSPAAGAGLRVGDCVVRFGDADWLNHEKLGRVARVVQGAQGRAVPVVVLRMGETVRLSLTPRSGWGGRGLLGCHLVPE